MQPTLRSQSGDATRDRYPALSRGFANQDTGLRYPHRLAGGFAQNNSSQQFGNANDCHDPQTGEFCSEGGLVSGIERAIAQDHRRLFHGYVPKAGKPVTTAETEFFLSPSGEVFSRKDWASIPDKSALISVHSHSPMNDSGDLPLDPFSPGDVRSLQIAASRGGYLKMAVISLGGEMETLEVADNSAFQRASPKAIDRVLRGKYGDDPRALLREHAPKIGLKYTTGLRWKLDKDKSHANDCHDEKGQFCEGGGYAPGSKPSASYTKLKTVAPKSSAPTLHFRENGKLDHSLGYDSDQILIDMEDQTHLTQDEIAGWKQYCGSTTSYEINEGLRTGKESSPNGVVARLTSAIDKAPFIPEGVEIYRGVKGANKARLMNMKEGDLCQDKAFQSFSLDPAVADWHTQMGVDTRSASHALILRVVSDGKIRAQPGAPAESEMILQRGSAWRVARVDNIEGRGGRQIRILTMEAANAR